MIQSVSEKNGNNKVLMFLTAFLFMIALNSFLMLPTGIDLLDCYSHILWTYYSEENHSLM